MSSEMESNSRLEDRRPDWFRPVSTAQQWISLNGVEWNHGGGSRVRVKHGELGFNEWTERRAWCIAEDLLNLALNGIGGISPAELERCRGMIAKKIIEASKDGDLGVEVSGSPRGCNLRISCRVADRCWENETWSREWMAKERDE